MLVSTSDLRVWMGIEDGDKKPNAKLESISNAVQSFVDDYCIRTFEAKRYLTDPNFSWLDGTGDRHIYLPVYPVSYVSSVGIDADRIFPAASLIGSSDLFWYPDGKLVSEGERFSKGRRNILIDFTAGYAPLVDGTHDNAVSTYPIPNDVKQVIIEMSVQSFKQGITAVHSVRTRDGFQGFSQLLKENSFWKEVLIKYKAFDAMFAGRDE